MTEQAKSSPQAGSPPPERRSFVHRAQDAVWNLLYPVRRFVAYAWVRCLRLPDILFNLTRVAIFRSWQGVAGLFGRRVIFLYDVRKISMLNVPVLKRLRRAGANGEGGILEVGPYIGGSTIALALGHRGRRKHVVVEVGGRNENPRLPSTDIIRDLKLNLKRFGCEDWVEIVQGWSNDPMTIEPAMQKTGPIGIFFFDANGAVAEQLSICAKNFRDDCVIILDDMIGDHGKADAVAPVVGRLEKTGAFVDGKMVEGTWFGKLGKLDRSVFTYYAPESGHAWRMPAPNPAQWRVEIFEDDKPLAPASSLHADIRERGMGAWSHWDFSGIPYVLFSTSDNSDPNENGRKYELRVTPR